MKNLYYELAIVTPARVSYVTEISEASGVMIDSNPEKGIMFSSSTEASEYASSHGAGYLTVVKYLG